MDGIGDESWTRRRLRKHSAGLATRPGRTCKSSGGHLLQPRMGEALEATSLRKGGAFASDDCILETMGASSSSAAFYIIIRHGHDYSEDLFVFAIERWHIQHTCMITGEDILFTILGIYLMNNDFTSARRL